MYNGLVSAVSPRIIITLWNGVSIRQRNPDGGRTDYADITDTRPIVRGLLIDSSLGTK